MCLNKSTFETAAARFVVSLRGEIYLQNKHQQLLLHPPFLQEFLEAFPIPTRAIPTVADVVQLLPVATEIIDI